MTSVWQRDEAEAQIRKLFEAVKADGRHKVADQDGEFEITFRRRKQTLEQLFAKPGPLDDEPDA